MLAVVVTVLLAWATIVVAPTTPIGLMLTKALVHRPAAFLQRITRGHLLLFALVVAATSAAIQIGGGEIGRIIAMATPDFTVWAMTFEVSAYLDVTVTLIFAASVVRGRSVVAFLLASILRRRNSARASRGSHGRSHEQPANEDDRRLMSLVA